MWQNTRTKVNPVMMAPKVVKQYVSGMGQVADDFVSRIRSIRDAKDEVPSDFANEMNKFALEAVAYIALDRRLDLLTKTDPNSRGQRLIQVRNQASLSAVYHIHLIS